MKTNSGTTVGQANDTSATILYLNAVFLFTFCSFPNVYENICKDSTESAKITKNRLTEARKEEERRIMTYTIFES